MAWPRMSEWYCGRSRKRLPMPLYRIVLKLMPIKLGSRKVLRSVSHVPSPTVRLLLE